MDRQYEALEEGLVKLSDWKKRTDKYLLELQVKVKDLRQKLMEEKKINGELQEIACDLQGRVSVNYQRAEEQGVEHFKEVMDQAQAELENAKQELEELGVETIEAAKEMTNDLEECHGKFDDLIHRYKNAETVDQLGELELQKCEEIKSDTVNAESDVVNTEKDCEELCQSIIGYEGVDEVMDLYAADMEQIDDQVNGLHLKLHVYNQ